MKITLNHGKLSKYLQYTSRAVSQKPNIPILANVKLEVDDSNLKLSATNLDMGINMWIPGVVEGQGSITVSAKYIADFVSAASSEKVDLELKDTVLLVKTSKSKANLNTIPSEEFPVLPTATGDKLFSISAEEFIKSMDKVIFSCSTDMTPGKIQQSGVLFEVNTEKEELGFVGLDGFRLSRREAKVSDLKKDFEFGEIIVPARYIQEFAKIIQDNEADQIDVFLTENKSQIIFKFDDVEFSIRLLEGPYPDYKKIMPDSNSYSFEIKKSELDEALKIISTFARSNLGYKTLFDFDLERKIIKLKSTVAEVGENETVLEVQDPEGESDLSAAYNLKYLQDIVSHIKGDKVRFETKGPLAASVFKDLNDDKFIHLLMPLRREV